MSEFNKINLNPGKILKILFVMIVILLVCHIIGVYYKTVIGDGFISYSFEPLFNLDYEVTVPSHLSSLLLLTAALILASIANDPNTKSFRKHWWLLAIVFVYLSFDEFCAIHEILNMPVRNRIDLEEWMYHFASFIPIVILLAVFSLFFIKFFLSLPREVKINFGISAFLFLSGALGMEILGAIYKQTFFYQVVMPIEEVLEMTGVSFFIYSLLIYKEKWGRPVIINIDSN